MPVTDWNPILRAEFEQDYWKVLQQFVFEERRTHQVFPPHEDVFAALHLTPYAETRVLIVGQDPYHGPGQAHGLCFSVRPGVRVPPSLANIYKELEADLGHPVAEHGNLESWARQGVLLLNTVLTVRAHDANSHRRQGWETFTDRVISAVSDKPDPVVFVLWGNPARKKRALIDTDRHHIVESAHPSPLAAHRGFFGSRPFSQINEFLARSGGDPIDWAIPALPSARSSGDGGPTGRVGR